MKWLIWPRQYGKTYEVCQWFLEDPVQRVIITSNEGLARLRRRALDNEAPTAFYLQWQKILKTHIVSFRAWEKMYSTFPHDI